VAPAYIRKNKAIYTASRGRAYFLVVLARLPSLFHFDYSLILSYLCVYFDPHISFILTCTRILPNHACSFSYFLCSFPLFGTTLKYQPCTLPLAVDRVNRKNQDVSGRGVLRSRLHQQAAASTAVRIRRGRHFRVRSRGPGPFILTCRLPSFRLGSKCRRHV